MASGPVRAQDAMIDGLVVLAPLAIEARALRRGAPGTTVIHTGMRARWAAVPDAATAVAIAGFAGGLEVALAPGTVVVASELRAPDGAATACPRADALAGELAARGIEAHVGPVASRPRLVGGAARARLARTGALAVDMESVWLARAAGPRPLAVLRVVVDTSGAELHRPLATLRGGLRAYRALVAAAPALAAWAARSPARGSGPLDCASVSVPETSR